MKLINKYGLFWLGLVICVILIGKAAEYNSYSFPILSAYLLGYFISIIKKNKI